MKKLLIMLMVVAMASFLFVGCLGDGVTPPVDDEDEDGVTPPTTVPPIITAVTDINIASSATQYVNAAEALDGIIVTGTAPTYSEVKVYINGITAGTGDAGVNGVFNVQVANADLIKAAKVEGAKTLHATATDLGLPESDSSNVINFILDTVTPFILSSVGRSGTLAVPVVIGTAVAESGDTGNFFNNSIVNDPTLLVAGDWKIEIITILDLDTSASVTTADTIVLEITDPLGATSLYTYSYVPVSSTFTTLVAGVSVDFPENSLGFYNALVLTDVGAEVFLTVVPNVAAVPGFINVTFNEVVTGVSVAGAAWNAFAATVPLTEAILVISSTVARVTEGAPTRLLAGIFYSISVSGPIDLAGNAIPATAPSSDTGVVIP